MVVARSLRCAFRENVHTGIMMRESVFVCVCEMKSVQSSIVLCLVLALLPRRIGGTLLVTAMLN